MTEEWIKVAYRIGPQKEVWDWVAANFNAGEYFRVKSGYIVEFKREEDAILFALKWC